MNILPHLVVLHRIRESFQYLASNTAHLNFILSSYALKPSMAAVYGKFIDQAIQWIKNHADEVTFCLGYRLDSSQIPSISCTFEGGSESQQFMGDFGYVSNDAKEPIRYALFNLNSINENGELVVSNQYGLETRLWRELRIMHGQSSWILKDMVYLPDKNLTLIMDKPVPTTESLKDWSAVSHDRALITTVGTSLDSVVVKVYMDVAGEPEMCEMLSCVMRYVLKQSRLDLMNNGMNEINFGYSSIMRNELYGQPAWTMQFTIQGKLTDEWILTESYSPDKMKLITPCDPEYRQ
jgi:hypothetical protein